MRLLKKGAEADIYLAQYGGRAAVLKIRRRKPYINPQLDERIRRTRTLREAQMISKIKEFGIAAPLVLGLDLGRHEILMQHIRGTVVGRMRASRLAAACGQIGRIAARLHRNGVAHGDMTTSNFIAAGGRVFVIDLGLASRTVRAEDHAVDLRLFKEVLGSAHAGSADAAWRAFAAGYSAVAGRAGLEPMLRRVAEIESRGRYATVV